jgi:hypothetical protein
MRITHRKRAASLVDGLTGAVEVDIARMCRMTRDRNLVMVWRPETMR